VDGAALVGSAEPGDGDGSAGPLGSVAEVGLVGEVGVVGDVGVVGVGVVGVVVGVVVGLFNIIIASGAEYIGDALVFVPTIIFPVT
jgi:hypothetical protein